MDHKALLLIGGGRWARVYLSVLADMDLAGVQIIVVSRHGGAALGLALAAAEAKRPGQFRRAPDLQAALARPVGAAILANAARDHVHTAENLLGLGIPVLVEKPVALRDEDAARLAGLARHRNLRFMPGHVLAHCVYLKNFFGEAKAALRGVASLSLAWRDPAGEARYGEAKSHDGGTGLAEDVGPHVATLLALGLGAGAFSFHTVGIARGGLDLEAGGQWDGIPFSLSLSRDSPRRERLLVLRNTKGEEAKLDFSTEPGRMIVAGAEAGADPDWATRPTPLTLQLHGFLSDTQAREDELTAIIRTTSFTVSLGRRVRDAQMAKLEAGADPAGRLVMMREVLAPRAIAAGVLAAGDNGALDALAHIALERLSRRPKADLATLLDEVLARS